MQSECCPNYINGNCRCGADSCDRNNEYCCIHCTQEELGCNRNRECGTCD